MILSAREKWQWGDVLHPIYTFQISYEGSFVKKKYFIKTHTLVEFKNQRRDCSICPLLWPALCEVCFSLNKSTPYLKKQNKTKTKGGLPWCLSGKESTCQCRKYGLHPWSGRIPHPAEQLSPCPTTVEPVLWSPCFSIREATTMRSLCTTNINSTPSHN